MSAKKTSTAATKSAGFTLLEVLIAMAIFAVALASILMVQGGSINAADRARQMTVVAMLAKNKMLEIEAELDGKSFKEVGKEKTGKFEQPYQDYEWKQEVKEVTFPDLGDLSGKSEENEDGNSEAENKMGKLVADYLGKAMREVQLTIRWPGKEGFQEYTVGMYWVDLNSEFRLFQ